MEMWIFLAAAGSGYLAKCWQNTQRNKDSALLSDGHSASEEFTPRQGRRLPLVDKGKWAASRQGRRIPGSTETPRPTLENLAKGESSVVNESVKLGGGCGERSQVNIDGETNDLPAFDCVGEFGCGHVQQRDHSVRRSDTCRFGKDRGSLYRRRALRAAALANKPMSSLESCLIAQISGDNDEFNEVFSSSYLTSPVESQRHLVVTDGRRVISRPGISPLLFPFPNGDCGVPCENMNKSKEEYVIVTGLPSLPDKFLERRRREGVQSSSNAGLVKTDSALSKRRKISDRDLSWYGPESNKYLPLPDTSAGFLLFNFGVGIGIMSTIMSSRREIERLSFSLRQTEELVQDLEEELEMQASLTVKDLSGEARSCLKIRQKDASHDGLPDEASKADENTLVRDPIKEMETMTSVEAELEAELEKLELNLHISKQQRKYSGISEIDPDFTVDVVDGELREDGLLHNAESLEDGSASTNEEFDTGNFAVSPRDLERRLHELIETRLQERIIELEAELEASQKKVRAFELGEDRQNVLNQKSQSLDSDPEIQMETSGRLENRIDIPEDKMNFTRAYSNIPVNQKKMGQFNKELLERNPFGKRLDCYSGSPAVNLSRADCEYFDLQNIGEEDSQYGKNMPLFLSLSGDALSAYNEAYDEFMKITSEKGTNMLDSSRVEDAKLSRWSVSADNHCYDEGESLEKDDKYTLHPDPFPLVSTTCWNAGGPSSCGSQVSCSSRGLQSQTSPREMDLEYEGTGSKNSSFPDNIVEDTSESTPCSLKFVDKTDMLNSVCDYHKSVTMDVSSETENIMINMDTLCRTDGLSCTGVSSVAGCQLQGSFVQQSHTGGKEGLIQLMDDMPEVSISVLDKIRSWGNSDIQGASDGDPSKSLPQKECKFKMPDSVAPSIHDLNPMSDESDYSSEADEELGKLLIKRIVEKTKQGSPIVRKAESILASLDRSDLRSNFC